MKNTLKLLASAALSALLFSCGGLTDVKTGSVSVGLDLASLANGASAARSADGETAEDEATGVVTVYAYDGNYRVSTTEVINQKENADGIKQFTLDDVEVGRTVRVGIVAYPQGEGGFFYKGESEPFTVKDGENAVSLVAKQCETVNVSVQLPAEPVPEDETCYAEFVLERNGQQIATKTITVSSKEQEEGRSSQTFYVDASDNDAQITVLVELKTADKTFYYAGESTGSGNISVVLKDKTTPTRFEVPDATETWYVDADDGDDASPSDGDSARTYKTRSAAVAAASDAGGVVRITLNTDVTLAESVTYHHETPAETDDAALILDLNGKTITAEDASGAAGATAIVCQTQLYVLNGTISASNDAVENNGATLCLYKVKVTKGDIVQKSGNAYIERSVASDNILVYGGYAVLSDTTTSSLSSQSGTVVLTDGSEVTSYAENSTDASLIMVGATITAGEKQGVVNSGTLALLDSYTHTLTNDSFTIDSNENTILSSDSSTLKTLTLTDASTLILGKSALIEGVVYVDNTRVTNFAPADLQKAISSYNAPLIYAASNVFTHETVATIESGLTRITYDIDGDGKNEYIGVVFGSPILQANTNTNADAYTKAKDIAGTLCEVNSNAFATVKGQSIAVYEYEVGVAPFGTTIKYPFIVKDE